MIQIKNISDSELLSNLKMLVSDERSLLTKILHYLREVEFRRLYLERGYASLFAFCVEYLGYEESQAQRRISAMRLVKEIPELQTKIESGALSLTALTQAQSFFRKEASIEKPLSVQQKTEVLNLLENKTTRECERELIKLNPEMKPTTEKIRLVSEDSSEVRVILKNETLTKLKRLKDLFSNKSDMQLSDLIDNLANEALIKHDPEMRKQKVPSAPKVNQAKHARYISPNLRQEIWKRDQSQCSFTDPLTHKKCVSKYKLHIDHVIPFAAGGETTLQNLRLLCANHNRLAAIHYFGRGKMGQYLQI